MGLLGVWDILPEPLESQVYTAALFRIEAIHPGVKFFIGLPFV